MVAEKFVIAAHCVSKEFARIPRAHLVQYLVAWKKSFNFFVGCLHFVEAGAAVVVFSLVLSFSSEYIAIVIN